MFAVLIVLLGVATYLAIKYPPAVAIIYGFIDVGGDGFGLYSYGASIGMGSFLSFFRVPLILAAGTSFFRLLKERERTGMLQMSFASLIAFSLAWIAFGAIGKGSETFSLPGHITYAGLPTALIALAYIADNRARQLFIFFVAAQLLLSLAILALPGTPLGNLSAINYFEESGEMGALQEALSSKIARVSGDERMFAQFINPNTYGLYAIVGILMGVALVAERSRFKKGCGVLLIGIGLIAWMQTVTRSATIGAVVGAAIAIFIARGSFLPKIVFSISGMAVLFMILAFLGLLGPLLEIFFQGDADMSISSRTIAFDAGMAAIRQDPLLGVNLSFAWENGVTPHQLPIFLAATYGIGVGVAGAALLFAPLVMGAIDVAKGPKSQYATNSVAVVFYFVIVSLAMANNFAAPTLFWIGWAFAILPLINAQPEAKSIRQQFVGLPA